jgi:beta-ureidopropionase / N-carbamoyl-L-amino-acid hydrolase
VSAEATAAQFRRWFDDLAAIGGAPDRGWSRFAWTAEDAAARRWFEATAAELDLVTERDANGNLWAWWGRPEPSGGKEGVLTGSHLDTVPAGGAFDGALGVVAGFTAVAELQQRRRDRPGPPGPPGRPIGVAAFADEEGARFNTATFGSRLLAGALDPVTVLDRIDRDGVTLRQAVADSGIDPDGLGPDPQRLAGISCLVELHIEQGLALDRKQALIGLATAIWPHGRWRLSLTGEANHAGTTLLGDRRDPTLVLARAIDAARLHAARVGGVATVGRIVVDPNSTNSVPAGLTAWLDARAPEDGRLDDLLAAWAAEVGAAADHHGVEDELAAESRSPAVRFDTELAGRIDHCLRHSPAGGGQAPVPLDTAAGHDAGALAAALPTAMLFVRNPTGVSHSPHEHADLDDCLAGALALADVLEELATP